MISGFNDVEFIVWNDSYIDQSRRGLVRQRRSASR